jgi:drug/metabolite transporter (DMT)-like permease
MARIWLAILIASFGWGTGGVATRASLNAGASPVTVAVYRGAIATVAVLVFLVIQRRGIIPRSGAALRVGFTMGITNMAVPFVLSNIALQYASAGFVGLMTALIPILTAVMAHFLLEGDRLTGVRVVGLVVALAGVATLMLSGDSGLAEGGRPVYAGILGLISVLAISYGGVYAKRFAGQYRALDASGIHFLSGTIVIAVIWLVGEGLPKAETLRALSLMAYLGLVSTFAAFALYYWMLQRVSATYASLTGYVVPVFAIVSGILLLDERLQPGIVVGGALILVGVIITDRSYRRPGRLRTPSATG